MLIIHNSSEFVYNGEISCIIFKSLTSPSSYDKMMQSKWLSKSALLMDKEKENHDIFYFILFYFTIQ